MKTIARLSAVTGFDFSDGATRFQRVNGIAYKLVNGTLFHRPGSHWRVYAQVKEFCHVN